MKKKIVQPLSLLAALLLPCLSQAHPHHHFPILKKHATAPSRTSALAKASAAVKTASVTQEQLAGLWSEYMADESDATDKLYDSLEVFFGGEGKYESREHQTEITPDSIYRFEERLAGTWKLENGNLITRLDTCVAYDSDYGFDVGCGEDPNDTLETADWTYAAAGDGRTISMVDTVYDDTSVIHYLSANAQWTLKQTAPVSIRAARAGASSDRPRMLLQMGEAGSAAFQGLDLRGRAMGRRRGQGFFIPAR
jgi:hypothetical protein